MANTNNWC